MYGLRSGPWLCVVDTVDALPEEVRHAALL